MYNHIRPLKTPNILSTHTPLEVALDLYNQLTNHMSAIHTSNT